MQELGGAFPDPTTKPRTTRHVSRFVAGRNVTKLNFSRYKWDHLDWTKKVRDCPVYRPTEEEFTDPLVYVRNIAPEASKYGICKIVSPLEPRFSAATVLENQGFKFTTHFQPLRKMKWNVKDRIFYSKGNKSYTYKKFLRTAKNFFNKQFPRVGGLPLTYLEKKFWNEIENGKRIRVEYGINVEGSGFSSDPTCPLGSSKWNLKVLPKLPDSIFRLLETPIQGVSVPMLYIGMLFSIFAWHVEDHYLYSINYHHSGAPKTWYGVPSSEADEFEKATLKKVYKNNTKVLHPLSGVNGAFSVIAGKTTMFPPKYLIDEKVSVFKAVQHPGEFIITFPRAYHAGFSNGFNCGEAVNFTIQDWFPYGLSCFRRYSKIGMENIIEFEELLVKEALIVHRGEFYADLELRAFVTDTFVDHIKSLNENIMRLNDQIDEFTLSSIAHGSVSCYLCKRDCYLVYVKCQNASCLAYNMCVFHGIRSNRCPCKKYNRVLILREHEIWEVEDAAQAFEMERTGPEEANLAEYSTIVSRIKDKLPKEQHNSS